MEIVPKKRYSGPSYMIAAIGLIAFLIGFTLAPRWAQKYLETLALIVGTAYTLWSRRAQVSLRTILLWMAFLGVSTMAQSRFGSLLPADELTDLVILGGVLFVGSFCYDMVVRGPDGVMDVDRCCDGSCERESGSTAPAARHVKRGPSAWERELFGLFATADSVAGLQLGDCMVADEGGGYLALSSACRPALTSSAKFPLDAWYFDRDDMFVTVLLHANFPAGCVSLLERFRVDGEPIQEWEPPVSSVTLGPPPVDAAPA